MSHSLRMSLFGGCAAAAAFAAAAPASAFTITPVYDSSITSLSNASAIETAFNAVANDYSRSFSNPVHVYVNVSWGKVGGQALPSTAVGASINNLYGYFNYSQVKGFLTNASRSNPSDTSLATAVKYLPGTAPAGPSNYVVTSAEAKALGLISGYQSSPDGYIGFAGSTSNYSFTPGGLNANVYDFQSVAAHELAEVLGRISGVDNGSWRTPLDLFRYSSPAAIGYNYNSAAYFSINGGNTALSYFNNSASGGDRGDWQTTGYSSDASDAFIGKGQRKNITAVDLTALDVLGWGGYNLGNGGGNPQGIAFSLVQGVPEPASWATMILGFLFVGAAMRQRTRNVTFA